MKSVRKALSLVLVLCMVMGIATFNVANAATSEGKILLAKDAEWKYEDSGKDLGTDWKSETYNDASWKKGKAPLGFGDDFSETDPTLPLATTVGFGSDPAHKNMNTYFRSSFTVDKTASFSELEVYIHVDDGAVIYINGKEAFRRGMDNGIAVVYSTPAKFKPKEETFKIPASLLKDGVNTIAAEVHQDGGDSSDLWFEMSIKAIAGTTLITPPASSTVIPDPNAPKGTVSKVIVTFNGNTTTAKGFTWYTTFASGNSDLQVVEKKSDKPDFTKATHYKGAHAPSTNSKAEVVHKAEATGLKSNTSYFFRVGDAALDLWSDIGTFKTAAKTGAFTFVDLADSQAKSDDEAKLSAETFDKARSTVKNADFFSINGDIVDTGRTEKQWDSLFGYSKNFLLNTTFMAIAGNHEEDKNAFYEHFNIKEAPGSSTESGAYYSFNYSNAHFVGLNTNEDSPEYADFSPAQVDWMKKDIKAAKAAGKTWIIVLMHKGPYSTSNHASDADLGGANGVRTLIAPMFNKMGVDLVLQGHDHIYARTLPIKNGKATRYTTIKETVNGRSTDYMVKPDGTIYLIPNTAGPKVYYRAKDMPASYFSVFAKADEHAASIYGPDPSDNSRPVRGMIQNFVAFTVNGKKLTAVTYQIDQGKTKEPVIVDQFGITKSK